MWLRDGQEATTLVNNEANTLLSSDKHQSTSM